MEILKWRKKQIKIVCEIASNANNATDICKAQSKMTCKMYKNLKNSKTSFNKSWKELLFFKDEIRINQNRTKQFAKQDLKWNKQNITDAS